LFSAASKKYKSRKIFKKTLGINESEQNALLTAEKFHLLKTYLCLDLNVAKY
jgi:hypothetical protein